MPLLTRYHPGGRTIFPNTQALSHISVVSSKGAVCLEKDSSCAEASASSAALGQYADADATPITRQAARPHSTRPNKRRKHSPPNARLRLPSLPLRSANDIRPPRSTRLVRRSTKTL